MDALAPAARGMPRNSATSLADSDEFRIYNAKILPCRKRYHHDWNECIFAHVGEKVQRRCPRKYNYMGIMCPDMKKFNECPKGDDCCFAHNSFEYWLHQDRYRTEMCTFGPACKRCICFFAHTPEELRGYGRTLNTPMGASTAPRGHNPSLRTPVVVGNRMDFPSANSAASGSSMAQQPALVSQAPYSQARQGYYSSPRPALHTQAFSPDPYSSHVDPYMTNDARRQPSPTFHALAPPPSTYPHSLPFGLPPTTAAQLANLHPTALPNTIANADQDPITTSARYISLLASRAAPSPTAPLPTLNSYPPYTYSVNPNPPEFLPTVHSPTASTTSSRSSVEAAIPSSPPDSTHTSCSTTNVPVQAPLFLEPAAYQHPPLSISNPAPAGRYSPFSPDSPLLALMGPQPQHPTPELLADQLADVHLVPQMAPSSHPSSRRPSLQTPTSPTSPQALTPPTTLPLPQAPSPAAVPAAMASKSQAMAYAEDYEQCNQYQHYMPQLTSGLAAVGIPQHLHPTDAAAPQYTMPELVTTAAIPMAQLPMDSYQQLTRTGPQLAFTHHRPSFNPNHLR